MKSFAKVGILFVFLALTSGCYKSIEFVKLESASVNIENNVGVINLTIKLNNPNFFPINISESDLDIYMDGTHLGLINSDLNVKLAANSESVVEIPIEVNILDLIFNVPNIWSLFKAEEVTFRFKGTITGKTIIGQKEFEIDEEETISL
jgi:LEA14-like dessication related protein